MNHWSVWLALLLAAPNLQTTPQKNDLGAALAEAQATWEARKPAAYEFTIEATCFCIGIAKAPPTFRVVGGEPSPVSELSPESQKFYSSFNTIERLFAAIGSSLSHGQDRSRVRYDDKLGFPIMANLDPIYEAKDDELYLRVTRFRIIEK